MPAAPASTTSARHPTVARPRPAGRRLRGLGPLPDECSPADRARVAAAARFRRIEAGAFLFDQGAVPVACYLVVEGSAEVRVAGRAVGRIGPGTLAGAPDVLARRARTSAAVAREAMTVWQIDGPALDRLLVTAPTFARAVAHDLGRRLREQPLAT